MEINDQGSSQLIDSLIPAGPANCYVNTGYHKFFIPVMGTGFTIDTPLKVAKFGITSVISIGDDVLIEQIRKYYSRVYNIPYRPIPKCEPESRVKRIRSYLNLVHDLVREQIRDLSLLPFKNGSDINKYFEMLPPGPLKETYSLMITCPYAKTKLKLQKALRQKIFAGNIDVNIMTKIDREQQKENGVGIPESGLAMTALRGFATSKLNSSIVLSAGINKRLFRYMSEFEDFFPAADKPPQKSIILKVSDYRSAFLQGTLLAKKGLWVSEYRIESGLNCGGHAFATKGELLGPVLEEFRVNRERLDTKLKEFYFKALKRLGRIPCGEPSFIISAQGGVGTFEEQEFLCREYGVDRVGWGTPFLLVPQATNVDLKHLRKLAAAHEDDVVLSDASPLGVPFWILRNSTSEKNRKQRIAAGKPGSRCPKQYLALDSEFSDFPICKASSKYQNDKLKQLDSSFLPIEQKQASENSLLSKTCLCMDLAAGVLNRFNINTESPTAVCSGLSIADFNKIYTLREMVDHIYGRCPIRLQINRPSMFIRELALYVTYLKNQLHKSEQGIIALPGKYFIDYYRGILDGIEYYRRIVLKLISSQRTSFLLSLTEYERRVKILMQKQEFLKPERLDSFIPIIPTKPA